MTITITIDDSVASAGIQTIGVALGLNNVTDEQARVALGARLKKVTYDLYLQGDKITREKAEQQAAVDAASQYITAT